MPCNYWSIAFLIVSTFSQAGTLTFQQALTLAYKNNPGLQAQKTLVEQAKGKWIQSRLYPNPALALQAENIGTPSTLDSGYTGAEETLSIEQAMPLGNRLYYQGQAAKMDYHAACLKLEAVRSSLFIETGHAYIDAFYAQYWTKASRRLVKLNELVLSSIKKRLEIGANSEVDLKLAEIALDEAIIVFDRARRNELKTKTKLANLIGATALNRSVLNEKGLSHQLNHWTSIKNRILTSNVMKAQLALVNAMGSHITATAHQVWPDVTLQLGLRHFKLNDQKALVFSATAPLPIFNQNQGNIHAAHARHNESLQDLHQLKLNLETTLYSTFLDGVQSKEEADKVTKRMLPHANEAVILARIGFEQGRYNYLILNNAMLMLNREEKHYTKAHADYHKAIIKIQGLLMSGTQKV